MYEARSSRQENIGCFLLVIAFIIFVVVTWNNDTKERKKWEDVKGYRIEHQIN